MGNRGEFWGIGGGAEVASRRGGWEKGDIVGHSGPLEGTGRRGVAARRGEGFRALKRALRGGWRIRLGKSGGRDACIPGAARLYLSGGWCALEMIFAGES